MMPPVFCRENACNSLENCPFVLVMDCLAKNIIVDLVSLLDFTNWLGSC